MSKTFTVEVEGDAGHTTEDLRIRIQEALHTQLMDVTITTTSDPAPVGMIKLKPSVMGEQVAMEETENTGVVIHIWDVEAWMYGHTNDKTFASVLGGSPRIEVSRPAPAGGEKGD